MKQLTLSIFFSITICFVFSILPISMAESPQFNDLNLKDKSTYIIVDTAITNSQTSSNFGNATNTVHGIDSHTTVWTYVTWWDVGWYTVGPEWYWVGVLPGQKSWQHYGYHNVWGLHKCGEWRWV